MIPAWLIILLKLLQAILQSLADMPATADQRPLASAAAAITAALINGDGLPGKES